jgi:hypothetical protein
VSIALLLISDGREEPLARCLASIEAMVPAVDRLVHVDDADHRLGFAGAIAEGWRRVLETDADHVFHVEQDFEFREPVDLDGMAALLKRRPYLAQVALLRQPWNAAERAAGGIFQQHPSDYVEVEDEWAVWVEHRRFFTTNPSLYRRDLMRRGWPLVPHSEGMFTHALVRDPAVRFAFWGAKADPPRVHHLADRVGHGY